MAMKHRDPTVILKAKFGKLTVLSTEGLGLNNSTLVNCVCECGGTRTVTYRSLKRNPDITCGCEGRGFCKRKKENHGHRHTREYNIWLGIIARCYNPKAQHYALYGEAGVVVCDRWKDSFTNFLADVGYSPSQLHSLDRYPNGSGNYEPENVRWATKREQRLNQKRVVKYSFRGEELFLIEWAELLNIAKNALCNRLMRGKWTVEESLSTPVGWKKGTYEFSLQEIASLNASGLRKVV